MYGRAVKSTKQCEKIYCKMGEKRGLNKILEKVQDCGIDIGQNYVTVALCIIYPNK